MAEERKYSIVGRVEIGTDEYRDLIEDCASNRESYSRVCSEKWKLESEISKLKEENFKLREAVDQYREFIKDSSLSDKFKFWKLEGEE